MTSTLGFSEFINEEDSELKTKFEKKEKIKLSKIEIKILKK